MACLGVSSLQNAIHESVAQNCASCWDNLEHNFGGYRMELQRQEMAKERERQMYEARTSKTAVLLSEAYQEKQRRIKENHERRRKNGVKKVEWSETY